MRSTQITTWRRYTAAEKKAYQARQRRRRQVAYLFEHLISPGHHFADNLGSRIPTPRVNWDFL